MNTEITIQVKGEPISILHSAFDTLLSFNKPKLSFNQHSSYDYISEDLLFASAKIKSESTKSHAHICLITIKPIDGMKCEMTISADELYAATDSPNKGDTIALFSSFLQRFEKKLNK